jgi:hypothetical protein
MNCLIHRIVISFLFIFLATSTVGITQEEKWKREYNEWLNEVEKYGSPSKGRKARMEKHFLKKNQAKSNKDMTSEDIAFDEKIIYGRSYENTDKDKRKANEKNRNKFVKKIEKRNEDRDNINLLNKKLKQRRIDIVNEKFYQSLSIEEKKKLGGRPLKLGQEDYEFRKRWMDIYRQTVIGPEEEKGLEGAWYDPLTLGNPIGGKVGTAIGIGINLAEEGIKLISKDDQNLKQKKIDKKAFNEHIDNLPSKDEKWTYKASKHKYLSNKKNKNKYKKFNERKHTELKKQIINHATPYITNINNQELFSVFQNSTFQEIYTGLQYHEYFSQDFVNIWNMIDSKQRSEVNSLLNNHGVYITPGVKIRVEKGLK